MRPADLLQLLTLACAWGGAYLFMRAAVPAFGPAPMVFLRLAMGSLLVLLPLTLWKFGPGPLVRHWKPLLIYGALFTAVPFIGLGWSARSISAGLLAVLQSAAPLFSAEPLAVGALWVGSRRSQGFHPRHLALLQTVCSQATLTLLNAN